MSTFLNYILTTLFIMGLYSTLLICLQNDTTYKHNFPKINELNNSVKKIIIKQ